MAGRPRLWTVDDFLELPGREKIELWDGRPVGPKAMERRLAPFRRTMVELRLIQHLGGHVAAGELGLFGPGFGFVGATGRALHPPDLAFIRRDRLPPEDEWDGLSLVAPDLAIEVLSPVDDAGPEAKAIADYLAGGVPLLWVIDPWQRSVRVHAPGVAGRRLTTGDELDGGDVLPGFRVPVAELFR
jgi:putative restriction endonuclease